MVLHAQLSVNYSKTYNDSSLELYVSTRSGVRPEVESGTSISMEAVSFKKTFLVLTIVQTTNSCAVCRNIMALMLFQGYMHHSTKSSTKVEVNNDCILVWHCNLIQ